MVNSIRDFLSAQERPHNKIHHHPPHLPTMTRGGYAREVKKDLHNDKN